jgi:hypothetical protein
MTPEPSGVIASAHEYVDRDIAEAPPLAAKHRIRLAELLRPLRVTATQSEAADVTVRHAHGCARCTNRWDGLVPHTAARVTKHSLPRGYSTNTDVTAIACYRRMWVWSLLGVLIAAGPPPVGPEWFGSRDLSDFWCLPRVMGPPAGVKPREELSAHQSGR